MDTEKVNELRLRCKALKKELKDTSHWKFRRCAELEKQIRETETTLLTMLEKNIKTCHYCGNEAFVDVGSEPYYGMRSCYTFRVRCSSCNNKSPKKYNRIDAILAWNNRPKEEMNALRAMLGR